MFLEKKEEEESGAQVFLVGGRKKKEKERGRGRGLPAEKKGKKAA